jgi:tetratricopeptide (TPR) repeat protein
MKRKRYSYEHFLAKRQKAIDNNKYNELEKRIKDGETITCFQDKQTITFIAKIYAECNDWENAMPWIEKGIIESCSTCHYLKGMMHKQKNEFNEYKQEMEKAIKLDAFNKDAHYELGLFHEQKKYYYDMEKHYVSASSSGCHKSMLNLGKYYQNIERNPMKMMMWYDKAIRHGNPDVYFSYGKYYAGVIDDNVAKKYYEQGMEKHNCIHCMLELACIAYNNEQHDVALSLCNNVFAKPLDGVTMLKLHNLYIDIEQPEMGNACLDLLLAQYPSIAIKQMRELRYSSMKIFLMLTGVSNPSKELLNEIANIKKYTDVNTLANKINFSTKYGVVEDCMICYDCCLAIPLNCGHTCCANCYVKIAKCPLCNY